MTPAPYPATFYIVDRWYDHVGKWGTLSDGPLDNLADVDDALIEGFISARYPNIAAAVPATLATVKVWHRNDAGWRDVTEDALRMVGDRLSQECASAADYPDAFLAWATCDIQDQRRAMAERDADVADAVALRREVA